jgi:hypothetical protein
VPFCRSAEGGDNRRTIEPERDAPYATAQIAVNPSSAFFLCFSIMELVSRG